MIITIILRTYNEEREDGCIDGHTPNEMFLVKGRLNGYKNKKQLIR
jgi:hypothetical protein